MNNKISVLSLETIQEKLSNRDLDSLEIRQWEKFALWRDKFEDNDLNQYLSPYLVIPDTKKILSQFLKICYTENWRILPLGNGSKLGWGKLPSPHEFLVSTNKLNNIKEHAKDDLTITVESGLRLKDLQEFLQSFKQFLPIDGFYPESATIGGIVATANTGSWRQGYGGVRDLILGISFLRGDGEEAKGGGKVVKNVAGYDLMKLFTGSYGNLGIITEVTFRLFPLPSHSLTLVLSGKKEGIYSLQKTLMTSGLTPTCADLMSQDLLLSLGVEGDLGLIVRFQGIEESVKQQSARVKVWGKEVNLSINEYESEKEMNLWQFLPKQLQVSGGGDITAKVGILASEALELLSRLKGNGLINVSSGVGYITLASDTKSHLIRELRSFCEKNQGFLTILNGSSHLKQNIEPWGYVGNGLIMMKKIKENFDSEGIFVNRL